MRQIIAYWIAASMLLLSGCQAAKGVLGVLGELQAVQQAVVKATGHGEVTVNLNNGRYLTVGMVNSPFASLPDESRQAKAHEIAQIAYESLNSRASLEAVSVTFVVHRRYLLLFNYTNAMDSFSFKPSELASPATNAVAKR